MSFKLPPPDLKHPVILPDGTAHEGTVFLNAVIDHPNWAVGDYSYASAFDVPDDWAARLAPYLYPGAPERLILGRFCQIADGALIITASANHRRDGFSTFPFAIFSGMGDGRASLPAPGSFADTIIGNDVWIGQGARVLPGTRIGNGAIIGAGAVVAGTIPSYAIVIGNRGRVARMRFDSQTIENLEELAWWDWPVDRIMAAEAAICGADIEALERARP